MTVMTCILKQVMDVVTEDINMQSLKSKRTTLNPLFNRHLQISMH